MKKNKNEGEKINTSTKKKKISEIESESIQILKNKSPEKIDIKDKNKKSSLYNIKNIESENKNKGDIIIHLCESEEEEEEEIVNRKSEKSIILKSIGEIHNQIKQKYNSLSPADKQKISYKDIETNYIKFYDLDEEINLFFLEKLNEYYLSNKGPIDNSLDKTSDTISENFFTFVYTLKPEDKKYMMKKFSNYFGENELFEKKDKIYFHEEPSEILLNNFINELLDISNINDKSEEYYLEKLNALFKRYSFPASKSDYKIPVKYNKEALNIIFILRFQLFLCTDDKETDKTIFFQYNIKIRIKAFNYFRDYLLSKNKESLGIEYILFCLITFFKYYELYYSTDDLKYLTNQIVLNFDLCSHFLYQSFNDKILYIEKIKDYIINIDEYNNYITNNKCPKNIIIKIKYKGTIYEFNPEHHYFYGDSINVIDSIINKNGSYNFDYLKKNKFQLFDDSSLNKIFNDHIKKILQSPLTKEYLNSFQNLSNVSFIFDNSNILEEIKNNTFWVPFPINEISGVTDKVLFSIFLNNSITEKINEKFLITINSKITTDSHEDINHAARLFLNVNNILTSKKTPVHEKIFKIESYNKLTKNLEDQGDMWEVIVFGKKIEYFSINSSLFLLNTNNFNLKIKTFKKLFREKQKKVKENILKSYLDEILEKKEGNELIKKINEIKPIDFKNCEDKDWINNSQLLKIRISIKNIIPCQFLKVGLRGRFLENW